MLATDPDADRVGIAMKCPDGSYELVSGNEMGVLLLDYICAGRIENGTMPKNPVAVKSIVSTPLADAVAKNYGVELRGVLTGFKWIGDQIAQLEAAGEVDRFIFGFEESYGYLARPLRARQGRHHRLHADLRDGGLLQKHRILHQAEAGGDL